MTSFPLPPWHGDQVLPELGSGSARPPERLWVLGVPVSPTPNRCPHKRDAPEFPSCVHPVSPHLKSSSRQSGPRSLTIQAPRQPATQLLSGCVPADSHAPPLYVRPPPRAHARPYTPRVTAGPAPACCPAPLPRACHVGPPARSVQLAWPTWSSSFVHPGLHLSSFGYIHPSS